MSSGKTSKAVLRLAGISLTALAVSAGSALAQSAETLKLASLAVSIQARFQPQVSTLATTRWTLQRSCQTAQCLNCQCRSRLLHVALSRQSTWQQPKKFQLSAAAKP